MVHIGIDPGLDGGIALKSGSEIVIYDCPIIKLKSGKRMFDIVKIVEILMNPSIGDAKVILERTQAMPGQGVASMWKIGYCQGMYEGILSGLGIEYSIVQAKAWQLKLFGKYGKEKTKEESIKYVKKHYPKAELIPKGCRVPKDGRADALCMASYSELVNGGK